MVDDDVLYLKSLEIEFLQHADFDIETFTTGELCIANLPRNPDVIILDYMLNGIVKDAMNGIETLDKIKEFNADIPVVMLSQQDKIDVAIDCMHHKAFDYVVKKRNRFYAVTKNYNHHFSIQENGERVELVHDPNVDQIQFRGFAPPPSNM
ncbi:MAG: response regulator [Cytophagales bacterium]|nr:response regulator [Cytophagales bacterium]